MKFLMPTNVLHQFGRIGLFVLIGLVSSVQANAQCVIPATPTAAVQASNCGQTATLTASGSTGNYNWYNVPIGGTALAQGNSFTTPVLYASTTYYVDAFQTGNPTCKSSRVALIVSPTPLASPSVQGATVTCGTSATIYAAGSTGNYFWYAAPTGGPVLGTGGSFTATVTQTTIFYVEAASTANPIQTTTFNYTGGQQNWTVPAGVFSIDFDVRGAQGGSNSWNNGGSGGRVTGKLAVTPGQTIYFYVGQQPGSGGCCNYVTAAGGWNGGGAGYSYYNGQESRGGGGASDIRVGGTGTNNRVVVAGGGGGAGGQACNGNQDRGGGGGGLTGQAGFRCNSNDLCYVGAGGTQNSGGQGAQCGSGQNGSLAQGGNAWGAYQNNCCPYPAGGGGGGYYGGGGAYNQGGGGGGSSFANTNSTSNVAHVQGFQSGNGQITINYITPYCVSARVPVQVATTPIPNPTVAAANLTCGDTALLQATGTGFFNWYSASTGGTLLQGNSATYSIPFVTDSMTVWVEALSTANPNGTVNFSYTGGTQTWVVPAGVYSIQVDAKGASANNSTNSPGNLGGKGGRVQTTLAVTPGQTLNLNVGGVGTINQGGWNGGGATTQGCYSPGYGTGGGGGTDIRIGGVSLNDRVLVAGGGGGAGYNCGSGHNGGDGGGLTGGSGTYCGSINGYGGTGGTQSAGGNPGNSCNTATGGAFGQGGDAYNCSYAGGGGGGWYGGGGGTGCPWGGAGGGGSSYTNPNICSNTTHTQGSNTGNGEIILSYTVPYCQSQRVAVNVNVSPLTAPTNVIGDSVLCGQTAVVSATPATTPVHWFPDLTNNTPFAIGSSVFLPAMYGSDTLYAASARTNTLSGTHTFSYTGAVQTWTVPAGITSVSVDMSGAEGGAAVSNPSQNLGGKGGRVQTTLSVTPGQILQIYVGEKPSATTGGWNGGGNGGSNSGGGGGGTDIRLGGITLQDRILSAGAGGGAGWACGGDDFGGDGGGNGNAEDGFYCGSADNCHAGFGASPTAGGQASQCGCNNQSEYGSIGKGGDKDNCYGDGGGGGGGHYGGGGGGDGGGGGGSSYADPSLTSNTVHTQGYRSGHGEVVISYNTTLICQSARVPAVVHIDSLPAPTVSAAVLFCDQGSTTFNVSGGPNTNYRWFDGFSGNLVGLGTSYTTPVLTQTDTLFVLYMQNGCPSKYDLGIVTIVPTPRVNVLPMGPFCSSDAPINGNLGLAYNPFTMAFQPSTGGGVWTGTGVVDSVLGTFDPAQAQIGNNTFVYSVNDSGCIGADSVTINVIQGPDATITSLASTYCDYDAQDTLLALNPNGTWSGTGIVGNNTQAYFSPSVSGAGTFYAMYTIVDTASGCTDRDSVMLTVNPRPNAGLLSQSPMCSNGAPIAIQALTPGGTYSGNGIVNAQLGTFDPSNNVTGTSQVYYTVTVNNCTANDSLSVVVNQAPDASFVNPPTQVCEQANTVYLSNVSPGGFWAGSGITNQMSSAFTPSVAGQGMATVTYQVSNQYCSDYDTAFIFVFGNPTVTIAGSNTQVLCSNSNLVLNATGASTYNWFNNGNPINGAFGPTYTVSAPGVYSVYGVNINACPDFSQNVVVTQGAQPIIYQVNVPTVCKGNPTTFTQTSAPGNGNTLVSFNWDFGNGNNGSGYTASETYTQPGTYNAMLVVTNTDGCSDSMMQVVQVWAKPVIDSIMAVNNCFPNPTTLNSYVSGPSIASWNWNISGQNPAFGPAPVINFPSQGTFNYQLKVTSTDGCVSTKDSSITIYPRPTAQFVASDVCQYDTLQFTDLSTGNVAFWNWNFGQSTDTVANPSHAFSSTGNIPVTLTVTTPDGCTDAITQTVNVRPTPVSTWFSNNVGVNQLTFNPTVYPLFGGNFYWTFGDGTSSFSPVPTKTYANTGWYTVCLTVEKEGCESKFCDSVRAYDVFSIAELDGGQGVQVYPNPFGKEFNMAFTLTQGAVVTADIRDLTGRLLGDFDFGQLPAGTHRLPVRTEAMDLSSGIYLLNVHINGQPWVTRILKD